MSILHIYFFTSVKLTQVIMTLFKQIVTFNVFIEGMEIISVAFSVFQTEMELNYLINIYKVVWILTTLSCFGVLMRHLGKECIFINFPFSRIYVTVALIKIRVTAWRLERNINERKFSIAAWLHIYNKRVMLAHYFLRGFFLNLFMYVSL